MIATNWRICYRKCNVFSVFLFFTSCIRYCYNVERNNLRKKGQQIARQNNARNQINLTQYSICIIEEVSKSIKTIVTIVMVMIMVDNDSNNDDDSNKKNNH